MTLTKILILGIGLIGLIALGLYGIGKKSVYAEATIPASPQSVWAVLTELERYPEWNPAFSSAVGDLVSGGQMKYQFVQDENTSYEVPATVVQVEPSRLLIQQGGMSGVITYRHEYSLESVAEGTLLRISESYRGIYVPFWNTAPVERAYQRVADALRDLVLELGLQ